MQLVNYYKDDLLLTKKEMAEEPYIEKIFELALETTEKLW